jgi:hypothetical protein
MVGRPSLWHNFKGCDLILRKHSRIQKHLKALFFAYGLRKKETVNGRKVGRERERALNPKSLSRIQKTLNRGSSNIGKLCSSHMGFKREGDSNGREVDRQTTLVLAKTAAMSGSLVR